MQFRRSGFQQIYHSDSEEDVITINGFDDFNLGIDFAEPHVISKSIESITVFWCIQYQWCLAELMMVITGQHLLLILVYLRNGDPITTYDGAGKFIL
ncbi:MAG: hypothetical protein MZV64_52520 [Ignavibacteriales bacterium]|nr:hypothetical protein [Ignavibacteriales bacterium]